MNSIHELMEWEADIIQQRRQGEFANKADLRNAVERLLDEIDSRRGDIATLDEWEWACATIIHWDSFLRSQFGTCRGIRLPRLREIGRTKDRVDYGEQQETRLKTRAEDFTILELKETLESKIEKATKAMKSEILIAIREGQGQTLEEEYVTQLKAYAVMKWIAEKYTSPHSSTAYRPKTSFKRTDERL